MTELAGEGLHQVFRRNLALTAKDLSQPLVGAHLLRQGIVKILEVDQAVLHEESA